MSRYLITGAAGFLGSILTKELDRQGHQLVLVDSSSLDEVPGAHCFIQCDLADTDSAMAISVEGPFDAVFHLASQIDFHVERQSDLYDNNVRCTETVISLMLQTGCRKLVFTSSNAVFLGYSGERAIRQKDPPRPIDEYGRSKVASENLIARYTDDFDSYIFRCPNILDAGRVGMLSIFFDFVLEGRKCWLLGDGRSRHQCVYSGDLINAMLKAMQRDGSFTFNIGSDNVPTIVEMYDAVIEHAGTGARVGRLPRFPTLPMMKLLNRLKLSPIGPYQFRMMTADFYYDCAYIKNVLGWMPTLDNSEMLCKAFDFYREHKDELDSSKSANSGRAAQGIVALLRRFS